jgi:carbon storage regulator CsrA
MLVLTRKLQQQIKIGEQITVTILKLKGNTVRVGIDAPRDVRVVRGELPTRGAAQEAACCDTPQILESAAAAITAPAAESSTAESEASEAAPVTATHLPLRRIRNRYGSGPLKRVIASCATLAK